MSEVIKVGMADLKICHAPDALTTLGLGSCVGIALRDPVTKVGGLAHIMLPDSSIMKNGNVLIPKFADTGIKELLLEMIKAGAKQDRIVAKIAGGAKMFEVKNDVMSVGEKNVIAVKKLLEFYKIPILAEDTGLNYGRTVIFHPENGDYIIKAVGKEIKTI